MFDLTNFTVIGFNSVSFAIIAVVMELEKREYEIQYLILDYRRIILHRKYLLLMKFLLDCALQGLNLKLLQVFVIIIIINVLDEGGMTIQNHFLNLMIEYFN